MTGTPAIWSPKVRPQLGAANAGVQVFALGASSDLGRAVASELGCPLASQEEREFEDGEHKGRPLDAVVGRDVYVVQSLHGGPGQSPNDKLMRLLYFIGALKDAGAARITAVVPYLCYARQDRRSLVNEPVVTRYVAALFEAVGADVVATLDVHNPSAFENAFRCRTVALTAAPLFVAYASRLAGERLCVVSPDSGGAKRAEAFRRLLAAAHGVEPGRAVVDKHRDAGGVSGSAIAGDVEDRTAIIVDDMIGTGDTLLLAAHAARHAGARRIIAFVTHGLFTGTASEVVADPVIERIVVTDAVPPFRLPRELLDRKVEVLPVAPLLAEAIMRMHEGQSLSELAAL